MADKRIPKKQNPNFKFRSNKLIATFIAKMQFRPNNISRINQDRKILCNTGTSELRFFNIRLLNALFSIKRLIKIIR